MKEIIVVYAPIGCLLGSIFSSPILGGILGAIGGIGVMIYKNFIGKFWAQKKFTSNKGKYISLQEAAKILSSSNFIKNTEESKIQYFTPLNVDCPIEEMVWKRDNPDKVHKETFPQRTIRLINLALHICARNNITIYGKRPSSVSYSKIPCSQIQYFDADYTRIYSEISRDSTTLIYEDICLIKKDFESFLTEMDDKEFGQIVHYALYRT